MRQIVVWKEKRKLLVVSLLSNYVELLFEIGYNLFYIEPLLAQNLGIFN